MTTHTNALFAAIEAGEPERVRAVLAAGADASQLMPNGFPALSIAAARGEVECVRALLDAGADVDQAADGWTALMDASREDHLECVRMLLEAGADPARAVADGSTALMIASQEGRIGCMRALLEAGANVLQLHNNGTTALEYACAWSLGALQLLCAYAPSRDAARAHLTPPYIRPTCARWLAATSRWTSPLHHFELLPLERVRALLLEGADVRAGDGALAAPTPLSLAAARLLRADGSDDDGRAAAALIVRAAAPWSPKTHALFPAAAKARAVEVVRVGWLLARCIQDRAAGTAEVEVAFRDAWLGHVMPHAIERSSEGSTV